MIGHNALEQAYENLVKYLNELKDEQKTDNSKYKTVVCNRINGPDRATSKKFITYAQPLSTPDKSVSSKLDCTLCAC